jgi:hypothetical protein
MEGVPSGKSFLDVYNNMPQSAWLMNNRILFFITLETGKSKVKLLTDLVTGEGPLSGVTESSMTEGMRKLSGVSYCH